MRLDITKQEAEAVMDLIEGSITKVQRSYLNSVANQIKERLCQGKINPNGWAPMGRLRPSWPENFARSGRRSNSFFKKPKKDKVVQQPQTAEEILASL